MIYYIADMHFGHANIIRHCGRPFDSVEEMDEAIIHNWNARVNANDDVYIVGDFSYISKDAAEVAKRLKGRKTLIVGNHDLKNLKNSDFCACFERIEKLLRIRDNGRDVVLCHYPIVEWDGYFRGAYHVYGHIHNARNNAFIVMRELDRAYNAGVDITGFRPVTLDELGEINRRFCWGRESASGQDMPVLTAGSGKIVREKI